MSETSLPLCLVLGRTRVGKGEFIKTAVKRFSGKELDITSNRMVSHTKQSARYTFDLRGKTVALMDTVGYDDSSGDDVSSEAFLKMLAETGKEFFYPPLVILRELSGSDNEWIKRIRSVFSSIICAIRSDTEKFESAVEYWQTFDLSNVKLFRLYEFGNAKYDGGQTRDLYLKDVEEIVSFYSSLVANRESLDFGSDLFQGTEEHICITKETKSENHVHGEVVEAIQDQIVKREKLLEVENGGHYEEREVQRDGFERTIAVITSLHLLGVNGWKETRTVSQWVPDKKQIAVDDSFVTKMTASCIKTTTTRVHYERDVNEIWKVLTGGIRIFKATGYTDWRIIQKEVLGDHIEYIPKQSESSAAKLDE